ncbi:Uncharacterised protein [Segatella copri]|nr:Uncharacterised protein [Segatella copri]
MIHFRIAWLQIGWAEVMNLCADPILCQKCFQLVSFSDIVIQMLQV